MNFSEKKKKNFSNVTFQAQDVNFPKHCFECDNKSIVIFPIYTLNF